MATALFQIAGTVVRKPVRRRLMGCPHNVTAVHTFSNYMCAVFHGDPWEMYCWCMDLVPEYGPYVAFIGVDARAVCPDDPYKLVVLTNMHPDPECRDELHKKYYPRLQESFMNAIQRTQLPWEVVSSVCERCFLWDITEEHVTCLMRIVNDAMCGRVRNLSSILESYEFKKTGLQETMIRVMAHFCYRADRM